MDGFSQISELHNGKSPSFGPKEQRLWQRTPTTQMKVGFWSSLALQQLKTV